MQSATRERTLGTTIRPPTRGRIIALPGIYNTRFQLAPFVHSVNHRLPRFAVEVRRWGIPFLGLHNLTAYARNSETAKRIAVDLARWRWSHPDESLYVVGYSGGGGIAVLAIAALPEGVSVDRLVLIAPAISPTYPLDRAVLPRVGELVVNYASHKDLQVGWGTKVFGTIDREKTLSAGAVGFRLSDPKLMQWYWSEQARRYGHRGNHWSYLARRWQAGALLPALDPSLDARALRASWDE